MDLSIHFREGELVVMDKEPAEGEESASCFLAEIDSVSWWGNASNFTDVSKSDSFEAFFTSAKLEWSDRHCVGAEFVDGCNRVGASRIPIADL